MLERWDEQVVASSSRGWKLALDNRQVNIVQKVNRLLADRIEYKPNIVR